MFRWINKQPGIQKFLYLCGHYQDIYDWISPLNKLSGLPFIIIQQSMGRNEYDKSGHLSIFTSLKLNGAFEVQFCQSFIFYTLSKTLVACRAMQLGVLKVKTLLNTAFNIFPASVTPSSKNSDSRYEHLHIRFHWRIHFPRPTYCSSTRGRLLYGGILSLIWKKERKKGEHESLKMIATLTNVFSFTNYVTWWNRKRRYVEARHIIEEKASSGGLQNQSDSNFVYIKMNS